MTAATGTGDTLTPFAVEHLPFMRPDYSTMTTPALVIAGGKDDSPMSRRDRSGGVVGEMLIESAAWTALDGGCAASDGAWTIHSK